MFETLFETTFTLKQEKDYTLAHEAKQLQELNQSNSKKSTTKEKRKQLDVAS